MRKRGNGIFDTQMVLVVLLASTVAGFAGGPSLFPAEPAGEPATAAAPDAAPARAAFLAAYPVFMHPRCLNCHPAGDVPFQGDDNRLHAQNVQRGSDGKGKYALKCTNCHQLENVAGAHMPPGVSNWHMPPPSMKMVFEGRSAGEFCRQLKDPAQNGGKSIADLLHHVGEDPLVLWGWSPGDGRSTPPLSHAEFVSKMQEWAQNGAACPE